MAFIKDESEDMKTEETFRVMYEETEEQTKMEIIKDESEDLKIEEVFSLKQEDTEEQTKMTIIKVESEDMKTEETFRVMYEGTEEQTNMEIIKEECEDTKIEETFSVKEDTETQTVCSSSWQKTTKNMTLPDVEFSSFEDSSCDEDYSHSDKNTEESSDDDLIPDSRQNSNCDKSTQAFSESSMRAKSVLSQSGPAQHLTNEMLQRFKKTPAVSSYEWSETDNARNPKNTFSTHKNYCYVCKKPQAKISRHFKNHQDSETEIATAFSLPKHSQERRRLLEKLRNRGNYEHNQEVMESKSGQLKVRRRPGRSEIELSAKTHVHCVYCKGLYVRKELWRHTQRCPSNMLSKSEPPGKGNVLILADIAESTFSQALSPEMWKILGNMKDDDISSVVRNDFIILQLSQCLYNKHGNDPTKYEYIRQKVREMGRLLLSLRKNNSIFSFEDAVKPNNFNKVVEAVKDVAGYNEESHSYKTPSLVQKLGRSLDKIGDIILCRAISIEDDGMTKAAERFKRLCSNEWAEHVTEGKSKSNKPLTIPFAHDVQLLHQNLERYSADAFESLKYQESSQTYANLAKVTLVQVIICNRRRAGDVSKITLECFRKIVQPGLNDDSTVCLSPFEQEMSKHFSRVEIMDKKGRKVAVLLNPQLVRAIQLLVDKRDACEVERDNPFLFGRSNCLTISFYKGQDCIKLFVNRRDTRYPEYLRSPKLRKQVATMSQILHLKDNELAQLANFLGHDIQVNRDYYRLSDASIEIAKISKLVLAMEKGTLANFEGKSLDDIEIKDEVDLELDDEDISDDGDEESEPGPAVLGKRKMDHAAMENYRVNKLKKSVKRQWSPNEVNAVMKHFEVHISKGRLATMAECVQCKTAEDSVLSERTAQNIRDFVRNRGLILKKKCFF
ncbi:uncharacterized protein [Pseudorasbora parva]|uniref:uncharacterized protein n=1 Tax=Pseudorasbora parva TaxID=51549 RepID=UPI00351E3DFC